jgi:hypothetical protein
MGGGGLRIDNVGPNKIWILKHDDGTIKYFKERYRRCFWDDFTTNDVIIGEFVETNEIDEDDGIAEAA